ncbi:hypothetical protein [Pseudomonas asiatica]|uniref:hypothetical protein n=1 Tax=Pseudomonas asiatica TaxID=2219225 RepID=UPI002365524F|nr:hypothetical protein [Pseudomonas asiatica]MDD1984848.1 hypothetical protein [Pseudomonas asiatica]
MTKATRNTVLRKPNKAELATLQEAAKSRFMNTPHGYDAFAGTDPKTGRAIGAWVEGAYISETVVAVTEILNVYNQKLEEGYTLHELGVQPYFTSVQIYFYRPQADLDAALATIYKKVSDDYTASIQAENDEIIERQVQLLMAAEEKKKAERKALEQQQEVERIRKEVAETLQGIRQQVKDSLGVAA